MGFGAIVVLGFGAARVAPLLGARGVRPVVSTGRPLLGAAKAVAVLRADPVAYICYHWALIVDAATGEWLGYLTIPDDVDTRMVEEARQLSLSATFYEGDGRRELAAPAFGAPPRLHGPRGITRLVFSGDPASIAAAPRLITFWAARPGTRAPAGVRWPFQLPAPTTGRA